MGWISLSLCNGKKNPFRFALNGFRYGSFFALLLTGIMKQLALIIIMGILFSLSSCYRDYPESHVQMLQTLEGEWEESPGIGYRETWERSFSGLKGEGFIHSGNSYSQTEKITIIIDDEDLIYTATVENQNEGRTIKFPLKSYTDSSLVFVNAKHDFPSIITYTFLSDTLLVIHVESLTETDNNFTLRLKKTGN